MFFQFRQLYSYCLEALQTFPKRRFCQSFFNFLLGWELFEFSSVEKRLRANQVKGQETSVLCRLLDWLTIDIQSEFGLIWPQVILRLQLIHPRVSLGQVIDLNVGVSIISIQMNISWNGKIFQLNKCIIYEFRKTCRKQLVKNTRQKTRRKATRRKLSGGKLVARTENNLRQI